MSWSTLKRNVFEAFNKANPDMIDRNLDNLNDDFKYLFLTLPFPVHGVGQGGINDLLAIINRHKHQGNLSNDNMSILNDLLAEIAMQDIVNADSTRAI